MRGGQFLNQVLTSMLQSCKTPFIYFYLVKQLKKTGEDFHYVTNHTPYSIFDNVAYGLKINRMARSKSELADRVEASLKTEDYITGKFG